jgi:hypothetical protein
LIFNANLFNVLTLLHITEINYDSVAPTS